MKRELKRSISGYGLSRRHPNCKAYPDEKGIETVLKKQNAVGDWMYCKAYPDEKGIETWSSSHHCR